MSGLVFNPTFFLFAIPAVLFAGISKGGFGSGAAFASATILALILPPGLALGVMLPLLMVIDLATLRPYWKKWSWPDARLLILGGLPGVVLGVLVFRWAPADAIRLLIGAISIAFVLWHIAPKKPRRPSMSSRASEPAGIVAGIVAGFTSFVSHAGGPPAAMFLLSSGLGKTTYQATTVLVFWAINIMKFVPYTFLGLFTAETALANLLLAPVALFGAYLGVRLHHVIPEPLFFRITYALLTLTGGKLIFDALT